ncbi:MAG: hypothetical protein OIN87_11105 [Candidatus Methanoperedens sp.]|nr:hypothetical protein [Candidatus Methanoperedens sp.]
MYEKINKYDTSPILQRLAGETPNELTPPEFILVRTSSLFYSCTKNLPKEFCSSLPGIEEIEEELRGKNGGLMNE